MNGRSIRKLGGKLDESLRDQDRNGVEVAGKGFQTKALCLEWDRTTTAERIDDARQAIGVPTPYLRSCLFEDFLVVLTPPTEPAVR